MAPEDFGVPLPPWLRPRDEAAGGSQLDVELEHHGLIGSVEATDPPPFTIASGQHDRLTSPRSYAVSRSSPTCDAR